MKLAIKGNPTKGKEVIALLEMLGGINKEDWNGRSKNLVYYIDNKGYIQSSWCTPSYYNSLTLEEFEKTYPYKVGDEVFLHNHESSDIPFKIIQMNWNSDVNTVMYHLTDGKYNYYSASAYLKPYKPMKKETKTLADYLKPGYIVEYDIGHKFVLTQDIHGNIYGISLGGASSWTSLGSTEGIIKVYEVTKPGFYHLADQVDRLPIVWERITVELTMQEIANRFGINVKQLRIKE